MPRNLRSVIERVTRGGRSVVSRRNFSSSLSRDVSEGSGDSVPYPVARLLSFAAGYGFGYYLGVQRDKEIEEYRQKVLNAGQDASTS